MVRIRVTYAYNAQLQPNNRIRFDLSTSILCVCVCGNFLMASPYRHNFYYEQQQH